MEFNEYAQFKNLWRAACENALGKPPSEDAVSLAFGVLAAYSLADVRKALIDSLKDSQFKPTPATVLDMLNGGRPEDRAREAFAKVKKAVQKIPPSKSVKFGDPCIHWAIEHGCHGWIYLRNYIDDRDFENTFEKFYVSAVRLEKNWNSEDVPEHLEGDWERSGYYMMNRGGKVEREDWTADKIVNVTAEICEKPAPLMLDTRRASNE